MPCSHCIPTFRALPKLKECKLLSKVRSNQFHAESQRSQLNELVSNAEKDLLKYEETIARLNEMMVTLENERRNLNRQVYFAKSLMAPIRKLPPEILRQIFIAHGDTNSIDSSGCDVPGLKVASICSHWRAIALDTTALWTDISLVIGKETHYNQRHVSLVETLLSLSARSCLSIHIKSESGNTPVPPFLPLICEQATRWKCLTGSCYEQGSVLDALASIKGHLGSLQAFQLMGPFDECSALVEGAPKLDTLALNVIDSKSASIPWNQIVDLTLENSSVAQISQSLLKLPKLENLAVTYLFDDDDWDELVQSHLNCLSIVLSVQEDETAMTKLFKVLTLSRLRSLSIQCIGQYKTNQGELRWSSNELPSLISRSCHLITSFSLEYTWMCTVDLVALLQCMPALAELTICEPSYEDSDTPPMVNDRFLWSINCHRNQHHNQQPFLTHLTSFTLEVDRLAFSMSVFVGAIHSRWTPSSLVEDEMACIKTVSLDTNDSIDPSTVRSLLMLRQRGLDIIIGDKDGAVLCDGEAEA